MLKIKVEGQAHQVQPFLYDLNQRPQIDLVHSEVSERIGNRVNVLCYIQQDLNRRMCTIQMVSANGEIIQIPILDLIQVEMEEGKTLFVGKVFDIFA